MKFQIFFFLSIIFSTISTAVEFSPASLEFNLEKNQQICKQISFRLDSQATVSDIWAENANVPWSVTQFESSAQSHFLTPNYQDIIPQEQNQVEVCISGQQEGNYRGALLFRQSEQGNSIVQFAVWLKISITGENTPAPQPQEETPFTNKPKKRSSSSGGGSGGIFEYVVVDNSKPKQEVQPLSLDLPEEKIELGSPESKTQEEKQKNLFPILAISFTAVIFILLIFLLIKK